MSRNLLIIVFLVFSCGPKDNHDSNLLDNSTDASNNILHIKGFIAGSSYRQNGRDAIGGARTSCSHLTTSLLETFDRFRFSKPESNDWCRDPQNESPFPNGYLYIYRPEFDYIIDPEDKIVVSQGPEIEGDEAPSHGLFRAFESFNARCVAKLKEQKAIWGSALVVGSCGDPETLYRWEYSEDHRREMPQLKIKSRLRLYLRSPRPDPEVVPIEFTSRWLEKIPDFANGIVSTGTNQQEIIVTGFSGEALKLDLKRGKILWKKNLTNPDPSSVRQTTSLGTSAISRDQKWVAIGGNYGYLALLDNLSGEKIRLLSCDPQMFAAKHYKALVFKGENRSLFTLADLSRYPEGGNGYNEMLFLSPNEQPTQKKKIIEHWQAEKGHLLWQRELILSPVLEIGLNHDETMLFVVAKKSVSVLSALDGKLKQHYPLSHYEGKLDVSFISGAAFSSDFRLMAISTVSGVLLIDTQTHKLVRRLRAPLKTELGKPEFQIQGQIVRAFDAYGSIYEWDMNSGKLIAQGKALYGLNYNGPHQMPVLSLNEGQFLVNTQPVSDGGVIVDIGRTTSIDIDNNLHKICLSGVENDLPQVTVKNMAQVAVWIRKEN